VSTVILQNVCQGAVASTSNNSLSINPCYPIKLDRGVTIVVSSSDSDFGAAGIIGYTEENTGA
jgi:hypothetical protein